MKTVALLALACALNTVSAWDTLGNGFKAREERPQETQTNALICGGMNTVGNVVTGMKPVAGCNVDQSDPETRTWGAGDQADTWDYITVAGGYPQGPKGTKPGDSLIDTKRMAFPVVVFIYYGIWAFIILAWSLMKNFEPALKTEGSATSADGETTFKAFKTSSGGAFCYAVYHSFTAVFIILFTMLLCDTYWDCEFQGPDDLCFKGSKPILSVGKYPNQYPGQLSPGTNQIVFFIMWCLGMAWALWNYFYGENMPNHFRTECSFQEATHVLCKQKTEIIVMSNPSRWVRASRAIGDFLSSGDGNIWYSDTAEVVKSGDTSFVFMCAQYVLQGVTFVKASVDLDLDYASLRTNNGITTSDHSSRLSKLGENSIPFNVDSWLVLLGNELSTYLYMYQFTFFMVWIWFGGLIWCSPQMVIVVVLATMSIIITRKNQEKIQEISEGGLNQKVEVSRSGGDRYELVDAISLVPGDKVKLTKTMVVPCDLIVTKGTCICDESGLTGESMPVRKAEVPTTAGSYDIKRDEKHTLFAGTTLLQADSEGSIAIVSQTGIRTAKGDLVSMILYPATMVFEYDEELKVVFSLLSVYATILFFISVWLQIKISPLAWVSVFAFACFTISQILPPLLAIALVVGHTKSANRLMEKDVLCVQPKRIAISGKIHAFMFDKTGTLTKQGLDFIGVHQIVNRKWTVDAASATRDSAMCKYDPRSARAGDKISWATATAHAVTYLQKGGSKEIVGNQVEVQMFNSSGWSLEERGSTVVVTKGSEKLTIEKRFEFDHHTMTMSVIVRDETGNCHVFCKGAPERVSALCDPSSVPADCDEVAAKHALQGCYVIGMSHRELGNIDANQVAKMNRGEVERAGELNMIGHLLFRNELKSDTAEAIKMIKAGDVRPVMVTGDNAHCGYYIAKKCGIVEAGTTIYLSMPDGSDVNWSDMANPDAAYLSTEEVKAVCAKGDSKLAITGKAMRQMGFDKIDDLLLITRIFARVQPDQKVQVIDQYIARGYITGMCGDGGNDCGALRKAHAGIALSDAEASVVSPFTAKSKSVMACVDVLCEGRCALVTSFAAYRFYITYGLNWSIVKTINFVYGVRMPIIAYLTIDSICSWLCAGAITNAQPLTELLAYRPTSSLFSPQIFQSVIFPWCVWMTLMSIYLGYEGAHEDHVDMQPQLSGGVGYWELGDTWESTVFTYFQVCPLIWCGVCYSNGSKFRQSVMSNWQMLGVWGSIFFVYFLVLVMEPNDFTAFFHVASNAHNGFNTASPVWMRYQFPRGCPAGPGIVGNTGYADNACSTFFKPAAGMDCNGIALGAGAAALTCCPTPVWYNNATGMGSWRASLPNNCALVNAKVKTCGVRCVGRPESCKLQADMKGEHNLCQGVVLGKDTSQDMCTKITGCLYSSFLAPQPAGMPTPGMKSDARWMLALFIFLGMFFMFTFEHYINYKYVHITADWEGDAKREAGIASASTKSAYDAVPSPDAVTTFKAAPSGLGRPASAQAAAPASMPATDIGAHMKEWEQP